jgi:hypothetical protein
MSRTHMLESVCCIRKSAICVHLPCYRIPLKHSGFFICGCFSAPYWRDISEVEYILKRQHQSKSTVKFSFGVGGFILG